MATDGNWHWDDPDFGNCEDFKVIIIMVKDITYISNKRNM